ncbi:BMP family protein [candidate division KSB1 bacterium]
MTPYRPLAAIVLLFCLALPGSGCGGRQKQDGDRGRIRVGLVFDIGGKGDKSFNDGAYQGLVRAGADFGIDYQEFEPGQDADREAGLRKLAASEYDLVIGIGFLFTEVITRVAIDFPDVRFACVDYDLGTDGRVPPNLVAIRFREPEGACLVGALAALSTETGTIGFIGGMDIALIRGFEAGYRDGAARVNFNVKVLSAYAGVTPKAFDDPVRGKELALRQIADGADVIFQASGSTGLGVLDAARERAVKVIWVDSVPFDRQGRFLAPGTILTTMIKRVDKVIYRIVEDLAQGKFQGGAVHFGLSDGGIDYQYDEHNRQLIPDDVRRRVEELKLEIVAGKVDIRGPTDR